MSSVVPRSHPAVLTTELQREVFSLLPIPQVIYTALVCKAWLEVSLNIIWKGPVGLEALVRLLAPTTGTRGVGIFVSTLATTSFFCILV